jgi:hypothetical protein
MAKVLQLNHALRCKRCSGYGFITVEFRPREQEGEKTCPECGGDGNNFPAQRLVRARKMGKKKLLSLAEFEQTIRTLIHGRVLEFQLGYNDLEDYSYNNYQWNSDGGKEKAIRAASVWRVEITGRDTGDDGIRLAAATLPALMQMVEQLVFQEPS